MSAWETVLRYFADKMVGDPDRWIELVRARDDSLDDGDAGD